MSIQEKGPGAEFGDGPIINATEQVYEGSQVQFRMNLPPDGRLFTSEWIHKDNVSGKVLIAWCQAVRDQIDADHFAKHARQDLPPVPDVPPSEAVNHVVDVDGVRVGVTDPEVFIRNMCESAAARFMEAHAELQRAQVAEQEAMQASIKWQQVADAMGIKSTEESDDGETESASAGEDQAGAASDDGSCGSAPGDLRNRGTDGD